MLDHQPPANETPFKWCFASGPIMVPFKWHLDPLFSQKKLSELDPLRQNLLDPTMTNIKHLLYLFTCYCCSYSPMQSNSK